MQAPVGERAPPASLTSIENFRDFGGYRASDGRLRRQALFRSAQLGMASEADLERLGALGFNLVVDLRRPDERARQPTRRWPGFSADVISNDLQNETTESWIDFVARADPDAAEMRAYMLSYYRAAPFEARHIDLFSRYFDGLSRVDGPVLVHCSAGKDRTGVLVALTHALAGVANADILNEFLLTNQQPRGEERAALIAARLGELLGRTVNPWVANAAISVEAAYLEAAFAAIRERRGSIGAYLSDVLNIDEAKWSAIEARLYE
jgi:protein tyrosine/serine phosphatase